MIKIKNVNFNNNNSNEELNEILRTVNFIKEFLIQKDLNDSVSEMNNYDLVEEMFSEEEKKQVNVIKYSVDLEEEDDNFIEQQIVNVLKYINNNKVKLQSNFSRYNALLIAASASQGYITNIDEDNHIVNYWKLTIEGLKLVQGV